MIVAIPSSGDTMNSIVSERFARCAWFCLYNTETGTEKFIQNIAKDLSEGAGPQVAEFLAINNVKTVYTAELGPKAENILKKLKIKIIKTDTQSTVNQLINMLNQKK